MEEQNYPNQFDEKEKSIVAITVISIIFHVFILVILPLLISLFSKPQTFEQPQTFELVSLPTPMQPRETVEEAPEPIAEEQPVEHEPEPIPEPVVEPDPEPEPVVTPDPEPVVEPEPKPEPKPVVEPEPEPKPVSVDDIFASSTPPPVQTSSITTVNPFNGDWYLSNLQSKIEQNWRPTIKDSTLSVEYLLTIQRSGSQTVLSGLSLTRSSGKAIIDTQAKRAIELAFPMVDFPGSYTQNTLAINYTLVPKRR